MSKKNEIAVAGFLNAIATKDSAALKELYYEHRKDFVNWAKRKHYPSEGKTEVEALKAYQRVFAGLTLNHDSLVANQSQLAEEKLEELFEGAGFQLALIDQKIPADKLPKKASDLDYLDFSMLATQNEHPTSSSAAREIYPDENETGALSAEQSAQVDRFLKGELIGEELTKFKVDMAYDEQIAAAVEGRRGRYVAARKGVAEALVGQFSGWETEFPFGTKRRKASESSKSSKSSKSANSTARSDKQSSKKSASARKKRSSNPKAPASAQAKIGKEVSKKKSFTPILLVVGFVIFLGIVISMFAGGSESEQGQKIETPKTERSQEQTTSTQSNSIYEAHFKPYEDVIQFRGEIPRDLESGINAYNHGDYEGAVAPLNLYVDYKPSDREARLYLGIVQLETGRLTAAKNSFRKVAESKEPDALMYHADWYLALTYLRMGQNGNAKRIFQKLRFKSAPGADYRERSRDILEMLD